MVFDDNYSQEHEHGLKSLHRPFTCTWPLAATCPTDANMDLVVTQVININMFLPPQLHCSKTMDPDVALRNRGIILTFRFHQEGLAWEQLKTNSFIMHECHI